MGASIYGLCMITAAWCAWLLFRAFINSRARLLAWSSTCFALLAVNNLVLVIDLLLLPSVDLFFVRNMCALLAIAAMLCGLVWGDR